MTGVSLAGAEFGETVLPGVYGTQYTYPTHSEVDYFVGKGMNVLRIPFRWERLQLTLGTDFDSTEQSRLTDIVNYATSKGAYAVIDPHNYARYNGGIIGSTTVTVANFVDFWTRLSTLFKSNSLVIFAIMNEPNTMDTATWFSAALSVHTAIRAITTTNWILIPGNAWTGAHSWLDTWYGTSNGVGWDAAGFPTDAKMAIEVHQYLDSDSGGTSKTCDAASGQTSRLSTFTAWAKERSLRAFLGETAGANNTVCHEGIEADLSYLEQNSGVWLGWTWWAAGPWWGDYMFSLEPSSSGEDKPQMAWLTSHLAGSTDTGSGSANGGTTTVSSTGDNGGTTTSSNTKTNSNGGKTASSGNGGNTDASDNLLSGIGPRGTFEDQVMMELLDRQPAGRYYAGDTQFVVSFSWWNPGDYLKALFFPREQWRITGAVKHYASQGALAVRNAWDKSKEIAPVAAGKCVNLGKGLVSLFKTGARVATEPTSFTGRWLAAAGTAWTGTRAWLLSRFGTTNGTAGAVTERDKQRGHALRGKIRTADSAGSREGTGVGQGHTEQSRKAVPSHTERSTETVPSNEEQSSDEAHGWEWAAGPWRKVKDYVFPPSNEELVQRVDQLTQRVAQLTAKNAQLAKRNAHLTEINAQLAKSNTKLIESNAKLAKDNVRLEV
eukprot:m51a1_g6816 putative endoglucanase precursor (endo- -beta-glucanase) (662) ;mRNA; f:284845-287440